MNFLDIDDVPIAQEGAPVESSSIIALPTKVDLPVLPDVKSLEDPFVREVNASGKKWVILTDLDGDPQLVLDADAYLPYTGEEACGLRICNFIESRRKILLWDLHEKAFGGLPVRLVGHNPGMAGVAAAESWERSGGCSTHSLPL